MSLVEASCVMPKVGLGDETNLEGKSGRSAAAASTVRCRKSTPTAPNSANVVLPPLIVRDEDKSSVMGLSRFITFSISSFLSMDPILTITSQVPN
jgi:hypothetical protein